LPDEARCADPFWERAAHGRAHQPRIAHATARHAAEAAGRHAAEAAARHAAEAAAKAADAELGRGLTHGRYRESHDDNRNENRPQPGPLAMVRNRGWIRQARSIMRVHGSLLSRPRRLTGPYWR
jgi:hypothetical protein